MAEKPKAVLINFWTAGHPEIDEKSPMELQQKEDSDSICINNVNTLTCGICRHDGRQPTEEFQQKKKFYEEGMT